MARRYRDGETDDDDTTGSECGDLGSKKLARAQRERREPGHWVSTRGT